MPADTWTWKLSEIRNHFRNLIGENSTTNLADATCNKWINDYYQNFFPEDAGVDDLRTFYTQSTAATDNGEYALAQTDIKLEKPVTRNNDEIDIIQDANEFFKKYPENEQYITAPTLVIGTSSAAAVKHSAFTYRIGGYSYSKASSEVSLAGLSTIPQNKYGAFALKISSAGTITAAGAAANSTGYDTPALAIKGLSASGSDSAYMGYVVVISTDAGGFIPGTTLLSDAAVTDTYTDGMPSNRGIPETVCIYDGKLYVRPRADDIYQIKSLNMARPSSFDSDTAVPADARWGVAIALGSAILYLNEVMKDTDRAGEILPMFKYRINSIRGKKILQRGQQPVQRSF